MVDSLLPTGNGFTTVVFGKLAPKPWPALGGFYQSDVEAGQLKHLAHCRLPAPTLGDVKPTFSDGSWSIADLYRIRHLIEPGAHISVTTTAIDGIFCPPCPPPIVCAPCQRAELVLADRMDAQRPVLFLSSNAEFLGRDDPEENQEFIGRRYRISGMLRGSFADSAWQRLKLEVQMDDASRAMLSYDWHSAPASSR
jgi:hypothetical protein